MIISQTIIELTPESNEQMMTLSSEISTWTKYIFVMFNTPTNLCMALYCLVFTLNTLQKHNNKERSKTMRHLTKPCINLLDHWTSMRIRLYMPCEHRFQEVSKSFVWLVCRVVGSFTPRGNLCGKPHVICCYFCYKTCKREISDRRVLRNV